VIKKDLVKKETKEKKVPKVEDEKEKEKEKEKEEEEEERNSSICVYTTRFNFLSFPATHAAVTTKPHLTNVVGRQETKKPEDSTKPNKNVDIQKMGKHLLSHHSMNKAENTRWKEIIQVEGSTRHVGINTAPKSCEIGLVTGIYNGYEDLFHMTRARESKIVQRQDVLTLFQDIYPLKYKQRLYV
jgi:hypothetical protein